MLFADLVSNYSFQWQIQGEPQEVLPTQPNVFHFHGVFGKVFVQ